MTFEELRQQHPVFSYRSYEYQVSDAGLELTFHFHLEPNIAFIPRVVLQGVTSKQVESIDRFELENLIFHLGLIEIPSYWKATCSPVIVIEAGFLNQDQVAWWHKLLVNGLGEFFYRNSIDFTEEDFVSWKIGKKENGRTGKTGEWDSALPARSNKVLVPLGGGKDSIVTLELLKKSGVAVVPFALNPIVATQELLELNSELGPIVARRIIDPRLLELNHQGYLNGHTPFSAYLAFLTYTVARLSALPRIALSNESSASEGNIEYLGREVNHQYSKSLEFEQDFQAYAQEYLGGGAEYFSFLRPLHEIQIAKLFVELTADQPHLHSIFRSCNVGQKTNTWCGECAKCLFAFIMLFPFLGFETEQIWGENLLEKESLLDEALDLIHPERVKPWDCVGTREESRVALYLSMKKYEEAGQPLPLILKELKTEIESITDDQAAALLNDWQTGNQVPADLERVLQDAL